MRRVEYVLLKSSLEGNDAVRQTGSWFLLTGGQVKATGKTSQKKDKGWDSRPLG